MKTNEPSNLRAVAIEDLRGPQRPFTQEELASHVGFSRFKLLRYGHEDALSAFVRGNVLRYSVESVSLFTGRQAA